MDNRIKDMLRLYAGDTRKRNFDNKFRGEYQDPFWGDENAYRTLNALLFDGIENEIERIKNENHNLNPIYLLEIENTIELYLGIFRTMCENKNMEGIVLGRRIERSKSLKEYERGFTPSFLATSKCRYCSEFAKKNGIVLLEFYIGTLVPYIDLEEVLELDEYLHNEEREILLPPFLPLRLECGRLRSYETRIKDMNGDGPVGKYIVNVLPFPSAEVVDSSRLGAIYIEICNGKYKSAGCLEYMNDGKWDMDYTEYIYWKRLLHEYILGKFKQIYCSISH